MQSREWKPAELGREGVTCLAQVRIDELIRKSGALQQAILNSPNFSVIATDEMGTVQLFNAGAEYMLGYSASEIVDRVTPADISDPAELETRARTLSRQNGVLIAPGFDALVFRASRGMEDIHDLTYICKDGRRLPAVVSITALRTDSGPIIGYLLIATDNTVRKDAEDRRLASERMFRELVANIPEALWIRDAEQQTIEYVNQAWIELNGLIVAPGDPVQKGHQTIHPDDKSWFTHERRIGSDDMNREYRIVRPDNSVRWVRARSFPIVNPSGNLPLVVEIMEDVTQRREVQLQLVHLSGHDALTGLPNRRLLHEALGDALGTVQRDQTVSFILVDIDDFKKVNDTFGHAVGDALLQEFALRLAKCIRPDDMVARLGGDEFAVLITTHRTGDGRIDIVDRIRDILRMPFLAGEHNIGITASIGMASCPSDSSAPEPLIRCADIAMYNAKASGRDTFRCYTPEMNARATEKLDVEGALRFALTRNEFFLHYQPKIAIESGQCTGVEALIRWNRPGHGFVLPGIFVPALEDIGLIVPVGLWVIEAACRQIHEWEEKGFSDVPVAVNVSSRQMRDPQFVSQVAAVIKKYGVKPTLLEFEITESTLMEHGEATDEVLQRLKNLGISISVDDFGTGYSSLAYLKRFPVDTLKIDIAFIREVTSNPDDAAITIAVINMAHSLRLKVIAEGVETQAQLDFLRLHGCDEAQGYYVSRPLPADQIPAVFQANAAERIERPMAPRLARAAANV